jgi:hypothetical protein
MAKITFSDFIGILGIVFAVVLLVLDKAGKLKGQLLFVLLGIAAIMTLFIAIGNSWVIDAPERWKMWRGALLLCTVALVYSGVAIWIYSDTSSVSVGTLGAEQKFKPATETPSFITGSNTTSTGNGTATTAPRKKSTEGSESTNSQPSVKTAPLKMVAEHPVQAADLVIRFTQVEPYRVERKPYRVFRIGIYNTGNLVADNVSVKLISINPRPRDSMYGADFPYPLFTSTGNEVVRINPGDEELFAVAQSWLSSENKVIVAGLNKKVPQAIVTDPIAINKDEVWRLLLRTTAANAKSAEIKLEITPDTEAIEISKIVE